MAKKKSNHNPNPVESIRHKDKRKNIPTEELRDFVAEDENAPKTMLYPRDPSLDPQLVWKGKDEQDQKDKGATVSDGRTLLSLISYDDWLGRGSL